MGYCCVKKGVHCDTVLTVFAQRCKWEGNINVKISIYAGILLIFCIVFGPLLYFLSYFVVSYVWALRRLRNVALCLLEKWFLQTITIFLKPWELLMSCQWLGMRHFGVKLQVGTIEALLCKSTSEWCAVDLANVWKQAIYVKVKTIWLPEWRGWEFKSLCLSLHFLWLPNDLYCISFYSITSSQTWN